MLHMTKAMIMRYWGVGVKNVAEILGGDHKHAANGGDCCRNHQLLAVTYEASGRVIIKSYYS